MRAGTCAFAAVVAGVALPRQTLAADGQIEIARVRKIAFAYAACVVKSHHAQASEVILETAENGEIMRRFGRTIDPGCLASAAGPGNAMRFPKDTYKFALADALVNADFGGHGAASFSDRLPLAQPATITDEAKMKTLSEIKGARKREQTRDEFATYNASAWLSRYGECVVRQDPVNARYWLLTPPETPEEISRIKSLQPAFEACLGAGAMKFSRGVMRGTVAVNYYRLAMATVVSAAGKAN